MIEAPRRPASAPPAPGDPPDTSPQASIGREGGDPRLDTALQRRIWLLACCLLLVVLAFVDRPGNIIADTKLDLAVDPAGFLGRALHLWDPSQFGQLQDQANGYLFPMGPFFVAGKLLALPAWVVQRLWISAVAIAAFLGTTRLAARLGIGSQATQVIAGFGYALAPRGLTLLGVLSGEFLPAAMLPWILLPLVGAVRAGPAMSTGGRVRAAARSAVAVALCSGNNAASVLVMLTVAVIYLLTSPRAAQPWRIFAWWAPAVVLATLWWLYPLVLLGKYGVSFLPYTESAAVTTSVTSLSNTLRGTEDWVSYLVVNGNPWWPIGFKLATGMVATAVTGLVAGLGLAGLLRRGLAARRFLLCLLVVGVLVVGAGYVSGLGNPAAAAIDHLLNGPLAPLRNLRKFDPLIRLPIALGLAHLLANLERPPWRKAASLAAALGLAVLAFPAFTTGLSTTGDFPAIPQYWLRTARWLDQHANRQAVLAVPGARFGEYIWGRPMDDVLEALFKGDWASRQLNGIGSVGNVRLLDAIDEQLSAGQGSAGLAQVLARMGVKYLLVRNDLIRSDLRGDWPARVHQAIAESPGITRVATFGTVPVGSFKPDNAISNFDTPYPAVEIYQVAGAQPIATVQPAAGTLRVYGAPEALLTMADQGLLRDRPVLLDADSPGLPVSGSVVTDSLRRRVRNFGELRVDYSPTLTASDPAQTFAATDDFTEPGWLKYLTVAQYAGITDVTASSSAADIDAIAGQSATGRLPFAAVDGDLRTMWESGGLGGPVGQWISIDFEQQLNPGSIGIAFADSPVIGPPVTEVTVSTAAGSLTEPVSPASKIQQLRLPQGPTSWLRITIAATKRPGGPGTQVGIAEISVPGVTASRTIVAPDVRLPGGGDPASFVLAKAETDWPECMLTSLRWMCSPQLAKPTEEQYGFDHSFTAAVPARMTLTGQAILTSTSLIERYAWIGPGQPKVTGSAAYVDEPQDQPQAAFDGDPSTTWVAAQSDAKPRLTIGWQHPRTVSQITVRRPSGAAGPLQVQVKGSAGQIRSGWLVQPASRLSFAPMKTSSLTLTFFPTSRPLQVSDVSIPGVHQLRPSGSLPFRLGCGFGPNISLDGQVVKTKVTGSFAALLTGRPVRYTACGQVTVAAGVNRITEPSWDGFDIQTAVFDQPAAAGLTSWQASRPATAKVVAWGPARRVVRVSATGRSYLEVNQNFNPGWQATIGGKVLAPVRLDGWKQAWLLPAGTAGLVTLRYLPDDAYRLSLFGGLALLGLMLVVAFVPVRRRRKDAVPRFWDPARGAHAQARRGPRPSVWLAGLPAEMTAAQAVSATAGPATAGAATAVSATAGPEAVADPLAAAGGLAAADSVSLSIPATARTSGLVLAGLALLVGSGIWLAGYPGGLILPVAVVACAIVIGLRWHPAVAPFAGGWLVVVLLLAAAGSGIAGQYLADSGQPTALAGTLSYTAPQVLCLIVVARMIAELVMTELAVRQRRRPAEPAGLTVAAGLAAPAGPAQHGPLDDEVADGRDQAGADGHQHVQPGGAEGQEPPGVG